MQVPGIELDDYRWLTGPAAETYLLQAAAHTGSTVALTKSLRKQLTATRTHLVLEQVDLRQRARVKFSQADRMFFTRQLLEQATGESVAEYKAARVPAGTSVVDACCGIGGDLLALAARGRCLGVDCDPVAVLLAEANAPVRNREVRLQCAAAETLECDGDFWHVDPDRRARGTRSTQLAGCTPGVEYLNALQEQRAGAIKLAPATDVPDTWADGTEREWIGDRRECRQQVVWFGATARRPGACCATVLTSSGKVETFYGDPHTRVEAADAIGRFVHEPHATVLAARLAEALASAEQMSAVALDVAYFTSDAPTTNGLLRSFEVLEVLPFDSKRIKAILRSAQIGRIEVKQRGVGVDPGAVRRSLQVPGDRAGVVLIFRDGLRWTAIVAIAQRP